MMFVKSMLLKYCPNLMVAYRGFRLLYAPTSYLTTSGFRESLKLDRPVDVHGNLVPWLNYAFLNFLIPRLPQNATMFEYGSGYSTLFFAKKVMSIDSVEHDSKWASLVSEKLLNTATHNVTLYTREADCYAKTISETQKSFDIVLVDGIEREASMKLAVDHLTSAGVIILDDTHREQYDDAIAYVIAKGFKRLDFEGIKPLGQLRNQTSVFYRPGNCLGI